MSLVVEKLTQNNFYIYQSKILQSLKEEYKSTYDLDVDDKYFTTLKDYCLSYMYVLGLEKTSTKKIKVLGYFSLSRTDLNKSNSIFNFLINYVLGNAHIFDIYVFPKFRGKGIGTYLVKTAIQKAKENFKMTSVRLYTQTEGLINFYQRNGFVYKRSVTANNKTLFLLEKKV